MLFTTYFVKRYPEALAGAGHYTRFMYLYSYVNPCSSCVSYLFILKVVLGWLDARFQQ